jgi:hypothetical protein
MPTPSERPLTRADLVRIAFVAKRFYALQGLRSVGGGGALIACVVLYDFLPSLDPALNVLLFAYLFSQGIAGLIDHYYRQAFGSVPRVLTESAWLPRSPWGSELQSFTIVGFFLDALKAQAFGAHVSVGATALVGSSLWIVVRDWPHRSHYAIGAVAGMAGFLVIGSAPAPGDSAWLIDPAVAGYYVFAFGLTGIALVAVGLLDHRLLVTAMWRPTDGGDGAETTPGYMGMARMGAAGAIFSVTVANLAVSGWPPHGIIMSMTIWLLLLPLMVAGGLKDPSLLFGFRAYSELTRAREARLLRRLTGQPDLDVPVDEKRPTIPTPDFWGHLVLPLAIACGALVDILVRGQGVPSFLALGLAASHARIAVRDWPFRKHYLIGVVAAATAAIQHMLIRSTPEWGFWFLILVSLAMAIEGALDLRAEKRQHHANAI